jgi:DNA repair protein RecN (Recombination protein N)
MIRELRIHNLAIIEELELELGPGLNILTGETGAGKSIILGALRLVLGERASSDDIRTGAKNAAVEASIEGPLPSPVRDILEEAGISAQDQGDDLILRRELAPGGKSKAVVNGRLTPIHQLKALGDQLVDLHGQHQHQSLLNPERHIEALDAFAETAPQLRKMAAAHARWSATQGDLARLQGDERALERERAMLGHQVDEIAKADLRPGEEEELTAQRTRLRNAERLRQASSRAQVALQEGDSQAPAVLETLGRVEADIRELAELDPAEKPSAKSAADLLYRVEDLAARMRDYSASAESDPARLEAIEDRLDMIRALKRKYGESIEKILEAMDAYSKRLNSIVNRNEEIEQIEKRLLEDEESLVKAAEALSAKRRKAARTFEKKLVKELGELQMERAGFQVDFQREPAAEGQGAPFAEGRLAVSPQGVDRVEFLLATNPGEGLKPLRRIASGGELSRIMLAMKSLLAARDAIPTLVFDEIDVGISGATADVLGEKMRRLGQSHQVICITHLPQIAARASRHFAVEKITRGKRATTAVRRLDESEREGELARLLGGESASKTGLRHARELLGQSG